MQSAPAISRSTLGRTLRYAGWLLGVVALAEIIAVVAALSDRARHNPPLTIQVPPPGLIAEATPPPAPPAATIAQSRPQPSFGDPFESITTSTPVASRPPAATPFPVKPVPVLPSTPAPVPTHIPALTPAPVPALATVPVHQPSTINHQPPPASLPKPTPVPEAQVAMPESRVDGLLAEARALRARGDTSTAVTRLREAETMSPKNALIMSELAETYEKMSLQDKALEQWRMIYDMGESAGIFYEAADAKLKAAELSQQTPAPAANSNSATADANGFQPGSSLALVNLSTDEKPETSEGYKRFTLKIPVKRRADAKIDVSGVVIQVFFYDKLGDDSVVRTNANVSSHWATLPADWSQDDIEILEVDYTQAPPEPGKIEEGRHYFGYDVRIYYNKALQDQAADPPDLMKKDPAPPVLPDK